MTTTTTTKTVLGSLLLTAMLAVGCAGGDTPTSPSPAPPAAATVAGLTVTGEATLNRPNQTSQLRAQASMSDGTTQDVTAAAQWSTDNPAVTTVTGGNVTAVSNGDATVTATHQGQRGTQRVRVAIPTKAVPRVTADLTVTLSPEPLYRYRGRLTYTIYEDSGVYGLNVNFINVTWYDNTGKQMTFANYNPSVIARIWGTNHIGAGQSNKIAAYVDYNRTHSAVRVSTDVSIGDDLGNQFAFSDSYSGLLTMSPTILADPRLIGEPKSFTVRIGDETGQ